MTSRFTFGGRTLRIEVEEVEVTSNAPRTDEAWTYTDQRGHEHYWRDGYPTLRYVVDETYWCGDCRDEHTEGHYECLECGEHITPGMRPPSMVREFMPGLKSFYLDDQPVSVEEAQRFMDAARAEGAS